MTDEKKPTRPVVIRKGHVKPPPPGTSLETPVVEPIEPAAAAPARPDGRPLWQRLAEQKKAELAGRAPAANAAATSTSTASSTAAHPEPFDSAAARLRSGQAESRETSTSTRVERLGRNSRALQPPSQG